MDTMYDAFPLTVFFHRIIQKIRRNATAAALLERVEESQNSCGSEYSGVLREYSGVLRTTRIFLYRWVFSQVYEKIRRNATATAILERVEESLKSNSPEYFGVLPEYSGVLRTTRILRLFDSFQYCGGGGVSPNFFVLSGETPPILKKHIIRIRIRKSSKSWVC